MNLATRLLLAAFVIGINVAAKVVSQFPETPPPATAPRESVASVTPKVPERKFTIPPLKERIPSLPEREYTFIDDTAAVVARLQRAAKEVRILEVWSLDPAVPPPTKDDKSRPFRFHDYHSLGHQELKDKEAIQKLLFSVTLAIAKSAAESAECFEPRHGLRIYDQKGLVDVLLCYSCGQGVLFEGDSEMTFFTPNDPEKGFDEIFALLGLKKAK